MLAAWALAYILHLEEEVFRQLLIKVIAEEETSLAIAGVSQRLLVANQFASKGSWKQR